MAVIALAGDTMLGRSVGERYRANPTVPIVGPEIRERLADTEGLILNLECCLTEGGTPYPRRVLRFRAPPVLTELLLHLGVKAVTLANNHVLDFGTEALVDTLDALGSAGIPAFGAGIDLTEARRPLLLQLSDVNLRLIGCADHPRAYAAEENRPGVAFVDMRDGTPKWMTNLLQSGTGGFTIVSPHWGPNFRLRPESYMYRAAMDMVRAGANLIAGHSAHTFQGVSQAVLYNMGDFVDDYPRVPILRNDLGLLWLVDCSTHYKNPRVKALPLRIRDGQTRLAKGAARQVIYRRLQRACQAFNTTVKLEADSFMFLATESSTL